jgi:hypothetical protein
MNPALKMILLGGLSDPDARLWAASVIANGGSYSGSTLNAVTRFCKAAKRNGYWSQLTRVNLMCGSDLNAARTPLKVGGGATIETITNIVAGDYVETGTTGGIKGNGTNKSMSTGWNPTAQSASVSSAGLWTYVKGTETGATTRVILGGFGAAATDIFQIGWINSGAVEAAGVFTGASAEFVPSSSAGPNTTSKEGFLGACTNGSRSQQDYYNGAALGSPIAATGTMTNLNLAALATNNNGTIGSWSTRYLRSYAITLGLSAQNAADFYADMQSFQTALGRQV